MGCQVKRSQQPGTTSLLVRRLCHQVLVSGIFSCFQVALTAVLCIIGGTITLNSSDPFVYPLINPNYLNSELDMFIMREGLRAVQRFVGAPAWKSYLNFPSYVPQTDTELNQFITSNAGNLHHPVGTAAMSAKNASYGVLDPDLRVKGVSGLRVVDSSAFVSPSRLSIRSVLFI